MYATKKDYIWRCVIWVNLERETMVMFQRGSEGICKSIESYWEQMGGVLAQDLHYSKGWLES